MLTLFVLPVDGFFLPKEGFFDKWPKLEKVVCCPHNTKVDLTQVETPFYAYCYANEKTDVGLFNALMFHYRILSWDFLVLYRKMACDSGFKYFRAPRVFRKSVVLDGLLPDQAHRYTNLHVLEGFLVDYV
jgi:hypothetical protein